MKKEQNVAMCKDPTEEEVVAVIWSFHLDKYVGPNGFRIAFYKSHWHIIKEDFLRMVKNVFKKKK